jgi:hypothetical protein
LKTRNARRYSGLSRKGGEDMANKKESKGNFFNFVEDATKSKQLQKEMLDVAKQIGLTGEKLLTEFHNRGYDGVSLRDCNRILNILKDPEQLRKLGDWQY